MSSIFTRFTRFTKILQLVLIQNLQRSIISIKRSWLFSPATQPDAWRVIGQRRDLYQSRVFKPKGISNDGSPLPLVIMVHGGGFIMNNPSVDDPQARLVADTCKCLVVSVDYRKAPLNRFPKAYDDIVDAIVNILAPESPIDLPIDRDNVFLLGSSAGGNLVLAAAQDPRVKGKLRGVIGIYPLVNVLSSGKELMDARPDANEPDFLGGKGYDDAKEIYAGSTDPEALKDPRLSPQLYRNRAYLPENVFLLGCEHDLLCRDSRIMAERLAEGVEKDERLDGWTAGNVRWKLIEGQTHAFNVFPQKDAEKERQRVLAVDDMHKEITTWLSDLFTKASVS